MAPANPDDHWSETALSISRRFEQLPELVLDSLRDLLDTGRKIVRCAESALMVPDAEGSELRFLVSVNSAPHIAEIVTQISVPTDKSIAGCVFTTGQLVAVENPDDFYPEVDKKTGLTTRSYVATPVIDQDEVLGVATFVNRIAGQPQTPFDQTEIDAAMRLADLAATGLRLYQRISVQQRLACAQLARNLQQTSAGGASGGDLDLDAITDADQPLERAIIQLERMSRQEQELAAELIRAVASHGAGY